MARRVLPSRLELNSPRRILERSSFEESQFHDALVGLAGADDPVVVPHGDASPFPLLDYIRVGFLDQRPAGGQRLAPPVAKLGDPPVDQCGAGSSRRAPVKAAASWSLLNSGTLRFVILCRLPYTRRFRAKMKSF